MPITLDTFITRDLATLQASIVLWHDSLQARSAVLSRAKFLQSCYWVLSNHAFT